MRSKPITALASSASLLFASLGANAATDEQMRLLEQRVAEMEDRLEATSEQLQDEKKSNQEQRVLLEQAGLVDESDQGIRSKVGKFFDMVNVSGVAAGSYNYRFIDEGDNDAGNVNPTGPTTGGARNDPFFTHKNGDSFQIDQVWITLDKAPTEESRAGFHADYVWGETAEQQSLSVSSRDGGRDSGLLYTGYVSYLAPVGNGVRIDAGKLATGLGAEVLQTNVNLNVTEGVVFQKLQPFTYTGITATTQLTDSVGLVLGVVNEVYRDNNFSVDRDKAGIAQLRFAGDGWGLNIGAVVGQDPIAIRCDSSEADCNTSVFDVTATFAPTDRITGWVNFDWVRNFGKDVAEGDKFGIATAARFGITDDTGIGGRFEYLTQQKSTLAVGAGEDQEYITATATLDHSLTEGLKVRAELRYDHELRADVAQFITNSGNDDSFAGIAQMYDAF
ncbi:outer membrane beta-barrel protein [Myxococcota bacterium]|nr:outer membrane beta-barrel protein [Myxococcota bacterium]